MPDLTAFFDPSDQSSPGHYDPSKTAVLLLDFHTAFFERVRGTNTLAVASSMRKWAKSQNIEVIHCMIDINQPILPITKDGARLQGFLKALKESGGADEPSELVEDGGNDVTFTRRPGHVSALKSPGLEDFLRGKGIKSLVLCGISTSGCVIRTAHAASDSDFVVSIISDACADPVEGLHTTIIEKLSNRSHNMDGVDFRTGYAEAVGGK